MEFKVGDWVVREHYWPHDMRNAVGVIRDLQEQDGWAYINVHYVNRGGWGFDDAAHFRLHLGEGDLSPYDTETILGIGYQQPDKYNYRVRDYWQGKIMQLCHQWEYHPFWELENTPGFEWAREQLLEFRREVEVEYAAEHGDDAPDPTPVPGFYGATPIPVEEGWQQMLTTAQDTAEEWRKLYQGALAEGQRLSEGWREEVQQLTAERDAARAAQDQLRDELVAVTAERDKYKARYEELHDERRKIWDMVMEADSSWSLTNDLYELMK